jgi:hypothetical protein
MPDRTKPRVLVQEGRYGVLKRALSIVGDVSPHRVIDEAVRRAEAPSELLRDDISHNHRPIPPFSEVVRRQANCRYVRTYVAYRLPGFGDHKWFVGTLIAKAVALGRGSPLNRLMGSRSHSRSEIRIYIEPMMYATTVAFIATTSSDAIPEQFERTFADCVQLSVSTRLAKSQLAAALKQSLIEHFIKVDSLHGQAEQLLTVHSVGGDLGASTPQWMCIEDPPERIGQDLFDPCARVIATLVPASARCI